MDRGLLSTDELEQQLAARQSRISHETAQLLIDLEELDRRQVATADGCRNMSEWTAATLDVGVDTARDLIRTMRRTVDRPDLRQALATGEATFDRIEAVSRITENVGLLEHLDVAGVRHSAGLRAWITAEEEHRTAQDRFLVLQPSLDESWWKLWGGLDGVSGAMVDKVLTETADQLPPLPDGTRGDPSWRKATALTQLCITDDPPPASISIFIDAD